MLILSFSSNRGHVTKKHALIGCKHDMFGNQTFELLQPLCKLLCQSLKVLEVDDMFLINKYGHNFKPGIPRCQDLRNEVIGMVAMLPISEISQQFGTQHSTAHMLSPPQRPLSLLAVLPV